MPIRKVPLINNYYYHIFNRGVNKQPIFSNKRDYNRMLNIIRYYQYGYRHSKFSTFMKLNINFRNEIWNSIEKSQKFIDIVAFCLMPNHFHLLVMQNIDGGISKFLAEIQNSYTKYYNLRYNRTGHLFQGQFKSVLIQSDDQLQHVSRYIHLNPYSSGLVKSLKDLDKYEWSSLLEYSNNKNTILSTRKHLINPNTFKKCNDYLIFVHNNADYQKRLEDIKHLTFD